MTTHRMSAQDVLGDWRSRPRERAMQLVEKYGQPDEICSNSLTWHNKGPWKRIVLRNEEIQHNFPKPHSDFLEQVIDYRVPLERLSDLGRFDGSVLVDRTKGEMSARCDQETANLLALNLAHDIADGRRSVEDARKEYTTQMMSAMMGQEAPYTERLLFSMPTGTADPDETTISETLMNKVKDKTGTAIERIKQMLGMKKAA